MFCFSFSGGNKQKWVPLNIEPSRPSTRGYFRSYRGESREHWNYGRRGGDREYERDRRGQDGNRYERGKEKSHRPLRFEREHGYKSRSDRSHHRGDNYIEDPEGLYNGRGNWQGRTNG